VVLAVEVAQQAVLVQQVRETTAELVLLQDFMDKAVEAVLEVQVVLEQQLLEVQVVLEQVHTLLGIMQLLLV
jgi:hypothetical protein